ncbi:class I SAM-dependent methyltransferase [Nocardioides euryhalodurans]|uniref:Class I SAM-dependent methyltransferase n=1 Tax=Nocardioides euryhalodurans TaxID=2518370 RepID=A0A4P7GN57_9ACTN|nr:class I SAM-dependent methyltransferase [Nocardioides euryhalodurans]QBR93615.1 class I SAM-dependent methyltransferase [Nocardioides euryhalodurans]
MDADAWDERYAASELVWSATPNQFVAVECADLPPGTAVDLAAGEGRNAIWLAGLGWQVTAVDFSQVALDKGRRLAAEALDDAARITWVRGDATTWQPGEPVDLVVLAYLQLPAGQRRAAVRCGFGSLRAGGTLVLVAHDSTNLTEGTGGPQDPSVLMTADEVLADLEGLDHRVVRAGRVAREVAPGDDHRGEPARTAWDCLVRVERV